MSWCEINEKWHDWHGGILKMFQKQKNKYWHKSLYLDQYSIPNVDVVAEWVRVPGL